MLISASLLLAATSLTSNWLFLIVLVTVGMLAIAFTPYRFVLGYFMLGMVYWIIIFQEFVRLKNKLKVGKTIQVTLL